MARWSADYSESHGLRPLRAGQYLQIRIQQAIQKKNKVTSAIQIVTDAIVADQLCCIGTIERRLQQADGSGIS